MEDLLTSALETFGYPVLRQGSMATDAEYPDSFFTFWNNATDGSGFYDNDETQTVYDYSVNFYSNDPGLTYTKLLEAKRALKSKKFIVTGKGYDLASDQPSHTGRGMQVLYRENN